MEKETKALVAALEHAAAKVVDASVAAHKARKGLLGKALLTMAQELAETAKTVQTPA